MLFHSLVRKLKSVDRSHSHVLDYPSLDAGFSVMLITFMISCLRPCHSYFFITVIQKGDSHSFFFCLLHVVGRMQTLQLGQVIFLLLTRTNFYPLVLTGLIKDVRVYFQYCAFYRSSIRGPSQHGNDVNQGLIKCQLDSPTPLFLAYFPPEIGFQFWKLLVQRVSKIPKYISDFHSLRMQLELGDITYLNEHLAAVFIFANGSSLKI